MTRIHIEEWPPYTPSDEAKKENVLTAAKLMVNAALTAPFTGGVPGHEAEIATGKKELETIAREMERLAHEVVPKRKKKPFLYEAVMVRESDAIIFIGNKRVLESPMDVGCGMCGGEPDCSFFYERTSHFNGMVDITDRRKETQVKGPQCVLRAHDLGYAVGSALWIAADLFVDEVKGNFYLAPGTPAIDSSANSLQDRAGFVAVKNPLGIPASPRSATSGRATRRR